MQAAEFLRPWTASDVINNLPRHLFIVFVPIFVQLFPQLLSLFGAHFTLAVSSAVRVTMTATAATTFVSMSVSTMCVSVVMFSMGVTVT